MVTATGQISQAAVALKAFSRIAERWVLNRKARATLLATTTRSVDRWEADPNSAELSRDQMERISYIIGIYGGLQTVLGKVDLADAWVRRPNLDFGDTRPIDRMLAGNVGDLAYVRAYVDRWAAGP
jgi:uncharacterized protein (DUF2384 family)